MNGHFTTEIGRMRCEEMVARGEHYQKVALMQRARDLDRPVVRRHQVARRRLLLATALSSIFMVLLSTAAMAFPANPGGGAGRAVEQSVSTAGQSAQADPSNPYLWIILLAATCALLLGALASQVTPRTARS
jgi:hypothetical protein